MLLDEFYLINAFTGSKALGNQACVLFVDDLSNDDHLQRLAANFNLPATTFIKRESENTFSVRWFAPMAEIHLCGHGTIAATWAVYQEDPGLTNIIFNYKNGILEGSVSDGKVELKGDGIPAVETPIPDHVNRGFQGKAIAYFNTSNKDIVVFEHEREVVEMQPNWAVLRSSSTFGYILTAKSFSYDFVSRVMLPHLSFLEDQATGSAHLVLSPFWADRLQRSTMKAYQASERGGEVECVIEDGHVTLKAACKVFGKGNLVRSGNEKALLY